MGLGDLFGKRHHRRPKYEGTIRAKHGEGDFTTRVPFHAKEVDAMFCDRPPRNASCPPPRPDELRIEILELDGAHSKIRISWNVWTPRRIKFLVLG